MSENTLKPTTDGSIDPRFLKDLAGAAQANARFLGHQSEALTSQRLATAKAKTEGFASKWQNALVEAGLPLEPEFYKEKLDQLRDAKGNLNITDEMFSIGVRFRNALQSVGADTEALRTTVPLAPDRSFSGGLGSFNGWPQVMTVPSASAQGVKK